MTEALRWAFGGERLAVAADKIRDGAAGRIVVETFGRDLDMLVEQIEVFANERMGLVVIPTELFLDRQAIPLGLRHFPEMEGRHALDRRLGTVRIIAVRRWKQFAVLDQARDAGVPVIAPQMDDFQATAITLRQTTAGIAA